MSCYVLCFEYNIIAKIQNHPKSEGTLNTQICVCAFLVAFLCICCLTQIKQELVNFLSIELLDVHDDSHHLRTDSSVYSLETK